MSRETIQALFGPELRAGLLAGSLALLGGILLGLGWRLRRTEPLPVAGILFAVATIAGIGEAFGLPLRLWQGVTILGAAGLVRRYSRWGGFLSSFVAIPGAWLVAHGTGIALPGWVPWFGFAAIVLLALLVSRADELLGRIALGPVLLALSVVGIFFAVPDTEEALVLLGACLPMTLVGWPARLASLGSAGSHAMVGLAVWTIMRGGYGRPGSMIGAVAGLGLLIVIPLVWRVRGPDAGAGIGRIPVGGVVLIAATQLLLVFVASRVVAVPESPLTSGLMAAALLLVAAAATRWVAPNFVRVSGSGESTSASL